MIHSTMPFIKTEDCQLSLFEPLLAAYPQLQNLVEVIALDGLILSRLHSALNPYDNIIALERVIGQVCARVGRPLLRAASEEVRAEHAFDTLVQIHVFWCIVTLSVYV